MKIEVQYENGSYGQMFTYVMENFNREIFTSPYTYFFDDYPARY